MAALPTITTNICWEGREKEGAVAERGIKNAEEEVRNRRFIPRSASPQQMQIRAIWSRLVDKIHFGPVCSLAVEIFSSISHLSNSRAQMLMSSLDDMKSRARNDFIVCNPSTLKSELLKSV